MGGWAGGWAGEWVSLWVDDSFYSIERLETFRNELMGGRVGDSVYSIERLETFSRDVHRTYRSGWRVMGGRSRVETRAIIKLSIG